jgi:hypothetical protein
VGKHILQFSEPTFAARFCLKTPFDHKIFLQTLFFKKFQPRFDFYLQKMNFSR